MFFWSTNDSVFLVWTWYAQQYRQKRSKKRPNSCLLRSFSAPWWNVCCCIRKWLRREYISLWPDPGPLLTLWGWNIAHVYLFGSRNFTSPWIEFNLDQCQAFSSAQKYQRTTMVDDSLCILCWYIHLFCSFKCHTTLQAWGRTLLQWILLVFA